MTGEENTRREPGRPLLRLVGLARPFWREMLLSVLLGALTIGSSVALMATSAYIISRAALHPSVSVLAVAIVGVRFFGLARGIFRYLERLVSHRVTFNILSRLRVRIYEAMEPLAPAYLLRYRSGDLLSRVVSDVETLQHFFIRVMAPPLVAVAVALGMGVFLGSFAPALAAAVLGLMLLAGAVLPAVLHRVSRRIGREATAARSELATHLVDGIQGAGDLIAFGQAPAQTERVAACSDRLVRLQGRAASLAGAGGALGSFLANLALWVVLVLAIPMVAAQRIDGVYLAVLALGAAAGFEAVLALPGAFQQMETNAEAARRLFELEALPPPVAPPAAPYPAPRDFALTVEDLRFRYAPDEPPALDGISFRLQPGKRLAIVGPSGSGKSTLAGVLLRFWDYHEGSVLLGGHDLRAYNPDDVRACMAVIPQQTHLFNTSIRENLLLARPEATEEEMVAAARRAQVHDFIAALPQGYDTLVGEHGLRLSAGERQRVAIARALLKDAPLLILDEPTANLDAATEQRLMHTLDEATRGRTTLLITHRLVGLEDADEILVLRAGRVIERGRHDQLLARGGAYRRMWSLRQK